MRLLQTIKECFWSTPKEDTQSHANKQVSAQAAPKKEPDIIAKMMQCIEQAKRNPRSASCPKCSNGWLMDYSDKNNPKLKPCPHT